MRARVSTEHQAAIDRRLALLRAELAGETAPGRSWHEEEVEVAPPEEPGVVLPGPETWWGGTTRLRGDGAEWSSDGGGSVAEGPAPGAEAPPLRQPGRHASRRTAPALRERLLAVCVPDTLRGRVALNPGTLATVALVIALAIALTCWFLVRSRPTAVPVSADAAPVGAAIPGTPLSDSSAAPTPAPGVDSGATASSGAAAGGEVTVDVAGRVRRPGIAVLPAGSRGVDALEAAGGARPGVDLTSLNLARLLVDGEQILVGRPAAAASAPAPAPAAGATGAATPDRLVNLNTADAAALETLPEVGPVTAQAIIGYRDEHGGFASVDELLDVDGIGEATLAQIRPWVTV